MRIQLSDHFTYKRLLRFVVSPICMMIFTSLYSIIDGFFVSNYVGKTPFAALNLIFPVTMGIGTIGFMVGTGQTAFLLRKLPSSASPSPLESFPEQNGCAPLLPAAHKTSFPAKAPDLLHKSYPPKG